MEQIAIIYVLKVWGSLWAISVILLLLRKDAKQIIDVISSEFYGQFFLTTIAFLLLLFCILPLTIPYSIRNIIKGRQ